VSDAPAQPGDGAHPASGESEDTALVCPQCDTRYPRSERFCARCDMPLVYGAGEQDAEGPPSESQRRARKVKPQYSEGALVKVARAQNEAEAELLAGILLEEGIPSMVRRSAGSDVPDFLAAGARDILVPESGAQAAQEALKWEAPPQQ
jgi:Putative prokaryotic signal transducing protein